MFEDLGFRIGGSGLKVYSWQFRIQSLSAT